LSWATTGRRSAIMGIGPVTASDRRRLKKAAWTVKDRDSRRGQRGIAAQAVAVGKQLASIRKANVNGCAIALGLDRSFGRPRLPRSSTRGRKSDARRASHALASVADMGIALCVSATDLEPRAPARSRIMSGGTARAPARLKAPRSSQERMIAGLGPGAGQWNTCARWRRSAGSALDSRLATDRISRASFEFPVLVAVRRNQLPNRPAIIGEAHGDLRLPPQGPQLLDEAVVVESLTPICGEERLDRSRPCEGIRAIRPHAAAYRPATRVRIALLQASSAARADCRALRREGRTAGWIAGHPPGVSCSAAALDLGHEAAPLQYELSSSSEFYGVCRPKPSGSGVSTGRRVVDDELIAFLR